jgi:parallel beta-helix repeat protein
MDVNITGLIIENPGNNGLYASCSRNMTMKNSTVENSGDDGIYLRGAFTPVLANNTIADSSGYGIYLSISSSTKNPGKLRNNVLTKNKYGFSIIGTSIESYYHDIDTSNTIDGKPMHYLAREENKILNDIPVGYLGLISCKNIEAKNLELTNNGQGVLIVNSSDSETDSNKFYLNNFINNADDVCSYRSTNNIWNSAEKITYTYNEKTYMNYMGNYWDDYTDVDADDDGIWDHPYPIDSDYDYYPLVGHVSDLADWLSVSPRMDTVDPGNQTDITVTLNTTGLDFGEYYANVTIASNDPDENPVIIPVRLTVTTSQKGDLNHDGTLTPADAAIVLQLAATGAQNPAADVSGDGCVTSLDALMILQAAAGNIEL